jgi:hypothetical protein
VKILFDFILFRFKIKQKNPPSKAWGIDINNFLSSNNNY